MTKKEEENAMREMLRQVTRTRELDERLAKIQARRDVVVRKTKVDAARIRDQQRKADTRRKILAGAMVLQLGEQDEKIAEWFMAHAERFFTKAADRKLFGLEGGTTRRKKKKKRTAKTADDEDTIRDQRQQ